MQKLKRLLSIISFAISIMPMAFILYVEVISHQYLEASALFILCAIEILFFLLGAGLLHSASDSYERKVRIVKVSAWILFFIYLAFLVFLLFFYSQYGRAHSDWLNYHQFLSQYSYDRMNLIPFQTISAYLSDIFNPTTDLTNLSPEVSDIVKGQIRQAALLNICGNIAAFAPMGAFLPTLFKKQRKFWVFFVTILCTLVLVETAQLLLGAGFCDIDDIILNALGAVLVFMIMRLGFIKNILRKLGLHSTEVCSSPDLEPER